MRLLVVGVVLALIHFFLYRRLVRATGLTGVAHKVATGTLVALFLITVVGFGAGVIFDTSWSRPMGWLGWTWMAVVFYLVLGLAVIGLLRLVRVLKKEWLPIASAILVAASVVTVAYGTVEASNVRVVEAEIAAPGLPPEFDGVRIAVVADLHVGPARGAEFTAEVVDLINAQRPDLVVLPGDLSDGTVELVGPDLAPLADLRAPLGVFGVAGNHEAYSDDVGDWLDHWASLGVRPLRNELAPVTRNGASISVAGVYDFSTPEPYGPDLQAALDGRSGYTILLAHQPRQLDDAAGENVDLMLAGHTHGGQMWPFMYAVKWVNGTVSGLARQGDTQLYTTVGAGAWGPPVRVGVPPEIVILTLTSR